MKLDLNFNIKLLNGEPDKNISACEIVANIIAQKTTHLAFAKAYRLAVDLTKDGYVELDTPDLDLLIKEISETQVIPNLTKAQIVYVMEETKNKPYSEEK